MPFVWGFCIVSWGVELCERERERERVREYKGRRTSLRCLELVMLRAVESDCEGVWVLGNFVQRCLGLGRKVCCSVVLLDMGRSWCSFISMSQE